VKQRSLRVAARLVWPITSPPIEHAAVLADDAGRIVAVGLDGQVPRPPGAREVRYPDAALLPGLVNAHTHLELHFLGGAAPEGDFFTWIQHMRHVRDTAPAEAYQEGARAGLRECWRHGVTTVADTGTSGATARALGELGGRGVYYQEVIGPDRRDAERAFGTAAKASEELRAKAAPAVQVVLSPHAPYTVSPSLLEQAVAFARAEGMPLAMHLAESAAETELISAGAGAFAAGWQERGIPLPEPARSPIAWADRAGLLGPDLLAIHAVRADAFDVELLAERGAAVACCPRSNRSHGHGNPPLGELIGAGIRVGLGTDSVASVEDLDLLAEARLARELAGLDAVAALRLATVGGAAALGLEREVGSLEPGKWADLALFELGSEMQAVAAPESAELASALLAGGEVVATYVAGRRVFGDS